MFHLSPKIDTYHRFGVLKNKINVETDPEKLLRMRSRDKIKLNQEVRKSQQGSVFYLQHCLPTTYSTENVAFQGP